MRWRREILFRIIIVLCLLSVVYLGSYYFSYFKYNDRALVEIEALKTQNKILQNEINSLNGITNNGDYLIGKVIFRNIHDFYGEIVVNLGSEDGINKNDAVLNCDGLVGIVYKVEKNRSFVKLLSTDYNISVKINDTYGNLNKGRVTLLGKYSEFNEGDKVYTSGYSGMQEGIFVGTIKEVYMDKNNLGKEASLDLIDNTNLNYVSIVRSNS